jgi:hypothetical protein
MLKKELAGMIMTLTEARPIRRGFIRTLSKDDFA